MKQFITKHQEYVSGILSGWDRIVFRGNYRILCVAAGMMKYLWHSGVLLKEFGDHAEAMTRTLLEASLEAAERYKRPVLYLPSSATRKEDVARDILRDSPVEDGLVCVLKCVEPCMSFGIHCNRERKKLELRAKRRKCLHLYHYILDPAFGLINARIQTWFPFSIQICLNGRRWLARKMEAVGLRFQQHDNSFPWIEDFPKAQQLMDTLLTLNWPTFLEGIRVKHRVNGNSVKMYDKGPNILRVETTINQSREFKVYRRSENDPDGELKWLPLRKGVADLHRRAQISQKANERYFDALATLDSTTRLEQLLAPVSQPRKRYGKRIRALRLWTSQDQALLEAINRSEFLLNGFRNRDLALILYPNERATAFASFVDTA